jgi:hypothetical protein
MVQTVIALFDDLTYAEHAVHDLAGSGLPRDAIRLEGNRAVRALARENLNATGSELDITVGAFVGALVGAVLAAVLTTVALTHPGPAPTLGIVGAVVIGALLGGLSGGYLGALSDVGVPAMDAQYRSWGVRHGGTLVAVQVPEEQAAQVTRILDQNFAVDIVEREGAWDPATAPALAPTVQAEGARALPGERDVFRGLEGVSEEPVATGA